MVSELKYEFFKSLYDEEADRYTKLAGRAQLYLSIITLYIGAFAFKFEDIRKFIDPNGVSKYLPILVAIVLLAALIFVLLAIRIRDYEGIADPEEIIEGWSTSEEPADSEFRKARTIELAVATNLNSAINNRVAFWLTAASSALAFGLLLHLLMLTIAWLG